MKFILTLVLFGVWMPGFTQSFDQRLVDHYGLDYLKTLEQKDLRELQFYLDSSYTVQDVTGKQLTGMQQLSSVTRRVKGQPVSTETFDPKQFSHETFNPLAWNFKQLANQNNYYQVDGTSLLITFCSMKEYQERLKPYLALQGIQP
jgi:hypothetical protein